MKSYIIIERGSRGEFEDVYVENSELSIEEFCKVRYENEVEKEKGGLSKEESLEVDEYMEEFGGVSSIGGGGWEIGLSEERFCEVYEIKV